MTSVNHSLKSILPIRFLCIHAVCLCVLASACWVRAEPILRKSKVVSLFNGKDLDGWVIENHGNFSVRDGLLTIDRGTGWLRSEKTYGDFTLTLEFRFLDEGANSGIFVRTGRTSREDENGWPDNGYQVQCMDALSGPAPLATMIPYGAPAFTHESDLEALKRANKRVGRWQRFEITCRGELLRVILNGSVITMASEIKNRAGHIGIQAEHGRLEFRKIRIRRYD